MRKELRPVHDLVACDLCERTILKGERIEVFVARGDRRRVCELCTFQALRVGWPRESELEEHAPQPEYMRPNRPLWSRVVGWAEEQGLLGSALAPAGDGGAPNSHTPPAPEEPSASVHREADGTAALDALAESGLEPEPLEAAEPLPERHESSRAKEIEQRASLELERAERGDGWNAVAARVRRPGRTPSTAGFKDLLTGRRREPREVHAVPTSPEGKLERAFELFNASEHRRTIAGIGRSLGDPWVHASPVGYDLTAREVSIVVAWELSWYRFRVDLNDAEQAVLLADRGDEIDDLDESAREWNAGADDDGRLALVAEAVS
jgi:hypothetical protein